MFVFESTAFQNAFWLFLGIVAGALVQHLLHRLNMRWQRNTAFEVLKSEIELNLDALTELERRAVYLKSRISGSQIDENELFLSMAQFDYSVVGPLVNQGFFHAMLGPDLIKKYFGFSRHFNNDYARIVSSNLRLKHEEGKSLDYLDAMIEAIYAARKALEVIKGAKLPIWGMRLKIR